MKQLNQVQVHTTDDWAWKKQVRFYMKSDHTCYVQMVDSELQYTYEYQVRLLVEAFDFWGQGGWGSRNCLKAIATGRHNYFYFSMFLTVFCFRICKVL